MRGTMRVVTRELAGLMLPMGCAGCGAAGGCRDGPGLCAGCADRLSGGAVRLVSPLPRPAGLPRVYAAAAYAEAPRAVLLAHKERGALGLARPLGTALGRAVRAVAAAGGGAELLVLVPVPSARRTVAIRGHDPVRRLARVAAARLRAAGVRAHVVPALRQLRPVADQAGLSAGERQRNVAGALAAAGGARRLRLGRVVLVDDVLTTGASLAEAARALRSASIRPTAAAVVAAPRGAFEAGRMVLAS